MWKHLDAYVPNKMLDELNENFTELTREEAESHHEKGFEVFGIDYEGFDALIESPAGIDNFEAWGLEV